MQEDRGAGGSISPSCTVQRFCSLHGTTMLWPRSSYLRRSNSSITGIAPLRKQLHRADIWAYSWEEISYLPFGSRSRAGSRSHKAGVSQSLACKKTAVPADRSLQAALRLLHRRASLGTNQPLSEIAYACGFRDYTHFARKFRHRFGHSPGAAAQDALASPTQ